MSESEREAAKKAERNRAAFEAWLERKREERQKRLKMERSARGTVDREQKRVMAQRAYVSWLRRVREEEELAKRGRAVERELRRLEAEKKREDKKRAEESFSAWKLQKDVEMKLQKRLSSSWDGDCLSDTSDRMTPSLPGYCSVWSCDDQLADVMTHRVPRGDPTILSTNHMIPTKLNEHKTQHNITN